MIITGTTKKELEIPNFPTYKNSGLEVAEVIKPEKPMFDNRDMCGFMCIICAALITYILHSVHFFVCENNAQVVIITVASVFYISLTLIWITQKIVYICYIRAKRKLKK